ncbi:MAG: hypothetical protein N2378_16645, partial [Chloroflexaceae bacterium]|nr:hypothetical protein [Chloroflexaceae bacterium]
LNAPLTAATAALLAWWAVQLGATGAWATALALLYGLATLAWPYARTFFSEPLAALLILLAAERADAARRLPAGAPTQRRALFFSGLAGGLVLPTRIAAGVALPVIGLYVLRVAWKGRAETTVMGVKQPSFVWPIVAWVGGLLPGLGLLLWYNLARFGTPIASGYASEGSLFTTPLLEGLYGLLFSPGKSVFLYAPALLLALPGGLILWRRGARAPVVLAGGLFLSHLLLYACWGEWHGGGVWGPRFLLPVVAPLLALAAGIGTTGATRWRPVAVALLGLAGLAANLGGVLFNFSTYVVLAPLHERVHTLSGSALVAHWRLLGERWSRYGAAPPVCWLGDGLYATEDPAGAPLPRRTGPIGALRCALPRGARLRLTLDDRRPPSAPPSALRLLLNGRSLGSVPEGQQRVYILLLAPGPARLKIEARPWNPLAVGFSERDDPLGPQVVSLNGVGKDGAPVVVADTAVAPVPVRPRPRWAWYYDPPNQHLVDHWAWYLPRSELAGGRAWLAGGLVTGLGAGLAVAGARLLVTRRATRARRPT